MTRALLERLIEIAREAAELVNQVYTRDFQVDYKAPRDPVTQADRRANELICARLRAEFPGVPIVAEESDEQSFAGFRDAPRVFFVDPVDGTREFVAKNGQFAVMIGLLDGDRPTHGVIHAPARHKAWAGRVGDGAFRIEPNGQRVPIQVTRCEAVAEARFVVSGTQRSRRLEQAFERLGAASLITLGSAGLKAAAVAEGSADVYLSPFHAGKRWDACAGDALVTAAGGRFTDRHGVALDYRGPTLVNDRGLVTAPPLLHANVLEILSASTHH